jgi:hypothetical protein
MLFKFCFKRFFLLVTEIQTASSILCDFSSVKLHFVVVFRDLQGLLTGLRIRGGTADHL